MGIFNFVSGLMSAHRTVKAMIKKPDIKRTGNISQELSAKIISDSAKKRTNVFGVVIHHTDTDSLEVTRNILKAKKLSTHFIIDKDGTIHYELPINNLAAACVGLNRWMLQIDLVGRCEINKPEKCQIESLRDLLVELAGKNIIADTVTQYEIDAYRRMGGKEFSDEMDRKFSSSGKTKDFHILMHGDVRPTRCPGKYLIPEVQKIRDEMYKFSVYN